MGAGVTLELPWPPTANLIWRHVRGATYSSAKYQQFTAMVFLLVRQQLPRRFVRYCWPIRVEIDLYPPTRQKSDIDNRIKPTLDALTRAGVWEDDSLVAELRVRRMKVVKNGKAVVRIEEVCNE